MMRRSLILVALLSGLWASSAAAQTIINPRVVEFTPSTDHMTVTHYEVRIYAKDATQPMTTFAIGKPNPDATNTCRVDITSWVLGLPYGTGYTLRVVAINALGEGVSAPSNPFDRGSEPQPPTPPTNVTVKR